MKKILVSTLLSLSIATFAKLNIGVFPGLTHSSQGIGMGGSVYVSSQISEKFSLGGKLGFCHLGKFEMMTKQDIIIEGFGEYYLSKSKKIMPFIGIGAGFHVFSENLQNDRIALSTSNIIYYNYNFSKTYLLLGLSPTVGVDFNLSTLIALRLNYTYSLLFTLSRKNDTMVQTGNVSVYSNSSVLQDNYGILNLGVIFKLGRK